MTITPAGEPEQHLRHHDKSGRERCFPVEVNLDKRGYGWGYVVALLCNGREVSDARYATHVEAYMVQGSLAGYMVTFPYFDGALFTPTLH